MMVEAVERLIDNIGAVTLDGACKTKIDAARKAYTKLSYAEKQQVGNYKTLQDAEAEYSRLQRADDQAKADAVSALIEMMGFLGAGNNPMVGMTVAVAVAVEEAQKA